MTDLSTNENGWLNATDNRRILFTVDSSAEVVIRAANGLCLYIDGNCLYDSDETYWGSVWILGNGCIEYCLKYDDFEIEIYNNTSSVDVAYMDDGYVGTAQTYEMISAEGSILYLACSGENDVTVEVDSLFK